MGKRLNKFLTYIHNRARPLIKLFNQTAADVQDLIKFAKEVRHKLTRKLCLEGESARSELLQFSSLPIDMICDGSRYAIRCSLIFYTAGPNLAEREFFAHHVLSSKLMLRSHVR